MNRENLQRMADHIRTVPQDMFHMQYFRLSKEDTHECNSVGCGIGHCTILDPKPLPRVDRCRNIDFKKWSERFTGIDYEDVKWMWCFAGSWFDIDNTPTGAADRIEWLLNHGLPEDWEEQLSGQAPLCYVKEVENK
jgi:hypothetical protein